MPLYEYHCSRCNSKFEKLQAMSANGADCPVCEQPARRAISVFAAVSKAGSEEAPTSSLGMGAGCACSTGGCGCGH